MAATHSARLYALGQRLKKSQMLKFACESVKPSQSIESRDVPPWFALLDRITPFHERNLPNPEFPAPASKCVHGVYMSTRDVAARRASFCYGCCHGVVLSSARGETLTERCARISTYEKSSQIYTELQAAIVAVEDDVIISGADAGSDEIAAREDAMADEHPLRFKSRAKSSDDGTDYDATDFDGTDSTHRTETTRLLAADQRTSVGRDVSPKEWREIKQRMAAREADYARKLTKHTRTRIAAPIMPATSEESYPPVEAGWSPSVGNQHGARFESCDGI